MASGQQPETVEIRKEIQPSLRIVRSAMAGVLVDESFAIPTEEIKKCLSIAQNLMKQFTCDEAMDSCKTFSRWLVSVL